MKTVNLKVVSPVSDKADKAMIAVFYEDSMIGIYMPGVDRFCETLNYLDLSDIVTRRRVIQASLSGYAYGASNMGEQIAADLAQMGYECAGGWITNKEQMDCVLCFGYDAKNCANRECKRLHIE